MTYEPYPTQPDPYSSGGYPPQPPAPQQRRGFGIAAMVVGIISLLLAFIPFIGFISFLLGLVAIGLGIFAVVKRRGKGQGIAGIITGAVSLVVALVVTLIASAFVSILEDELQNPEDFFEMDPQELEELLETPDAEIDAASEGLDDILNTPLAYSSLTVIGDEEALPAGEAGEVSVVAISRSEENTTFPFIVQNQTDEAISRVEVSGRAVDSDGETLGTGSSHAVYPNVVLPGGYAFGYVYVDSSDYTLPSGATIPDLRLEFTEGLGSYESLISLDIENFEELSNGDLTGDVVNPHDIDVGGPIGVDTVCLSGDDHVTYDQTYTDNDHIDASDSSTWTLRSYREIPECTVRLLSSNGYDW